MATVRDILKALDVITSGRVITEGGQILLGGNDSYVAMCHKCWVDKIRAQKEAEEK